MRVLSWDALGCLESHNAPTGAASRYNRLLRKPEKPSPTEGDFLFEMDPEPARESWTSWGGVPLLVRAFRSLGLPQSVQRNVRVKQRQRGYDDATLVESFVLLNALGGDCLEHRQGRCQQRGGGDPRDQQHPHCGRQGHGTLKPRRATYPCSAPSKNTL